jgi:hypothetical protein
MALHNVDLTLAGVDRALTIDIRDLLFDSTPWGTEEKNRPRSRDARACSIAQRLSLRLSFDASTFRDASSYQNPGAGLLNATRSGRIVGNPEAIRKRNMSSTE